MFRWSWKLEERELQRQAIKETQRLLKNRRKMLKLLHLGSNGGDESESESSESGAEGFGIRGVSGEGLQPAEGGSEEEDQILPLWTFDPESALPEDLETVSEVLKTLISTCD